MKSDFVDELYFSAAFPLPFRVLCLVGLGILGWATNLHGLSIWRVDAAGTLELSVTTPDGYRLTSPLPTDRRQGSWKHGQYVVGVHRPVYRVFVAYAAWTVLCWLVYRYATHGDVSLVDSFKFIPAIATLCVLTALICPFNVLYKHERDRFLQYVSRSPHSTFFGGLTSCIVPFIDVYSPPLTGCISQT